MGHPVCIKIKLVHTLTALNVYSSASADNVAYL